jgi:hypothetical protein
MRVIARVQCSAELDVLLLAGRTSDRWLVGQNAARGEVLHEVRDEEVREEPPLGRQILKEALDDRLRSKVLRLESAFRAPQPVAIALATSRAEDAHR